MDNKMNQDEIQIKEMLSSRSATPENDFRNKLLHQLLVRQKQVQLTQRRTSMAKAKSKNTISNKSWFVLAGGATCLVVAIALVTFGLPGPKHKNIPMGSDSSTTGLQQDDRGLGREEQFKSVAEATKKLPFTPYVITQPVASETLGGITGLFDASETPESSQKSITGLYINYKKDNQPLYTLSQSTLVTHEQYNDGSQELSIQFDGQTIAAHFVAPQDFEKEGHKRTGGQLYWDYKGISYSIGDDMGGLNGITKPQFLQLAESLKLYDQ